MQPPKTIFIRKIRFKSSSQTRKKKRLEPKKTPQKNESPKPNTPTLQSLNPSTPEAQSKDGHIQQMPRGVQPGVQPSLPFIHLAPHRPRSLLSGFQGSGGENSPIEGGGI